MNDVTNNEQITPDANAVVQALETGAKTTPPEQEAPRQPDHSWVPKRISEITAQRRAAEERAARLESELTALKAAQSTANGAQTATGQFQGTPAKPEDIQALARSYAEKMVRDERETASINSRIAEINAAGAKDFGQDFQASVDNLGAAGVGGPEFLKAITAIPNAEKLVTWLGKHENLNDAMRVVSLDPVQMGVELMKLSAQANKAFAKPVSKVPAPAANLDGRAATDGDEPDPKDTNAWMAWRSKTRKSKR